MIEELKNDYSATTIDHQFKLSNRSSKAVASEKAEQAHHQLLSDQPILVGPETQPVVEELSTKNEPLILSEDHKNVKSQENVYNEYNNNQAIVE